jgi:hypothetical protein
VQINENMLEKIKNRWYNRFDEEKNGDKTTASEYNYEQRRKL